MYTESTKEEHWYFFAVTGINITQKILNTLKDSKDQVYKIDIEGPILSYLKQANIKAEDISQTFYPLMTYLYFNIFTLFNEEWVKAKPGIMQFNQFLDDIYGLKFHKNIKQILSGYEESRKANQPSKEDILASLQGGFKNLASVSLATNFETKQFTDKMKPKENPKKVEAVEKADIDMSELFGGDSDY